MVTLAALFAQPDNEAVLRHLNVGGPADARSFAAAHSMLACVDGELRVLLEVAGAKAFNDIHTDAQGRQGQGADRSGDHANDLGQDGSHD